MVLAGGETFENCFIGGRKEMLDLIETKKLAYDQVPLVEVTPRVQCYHLSAVLGLRVRAFHPTTSVWCKTA